MQDYKALLDGLSPKKRKFVEVYVAGAGAPAENGAEAFRQAGFYLARPEKLGLRVNMLMRDDKVSAAIEAWREHAMVRNDVQLDEIVQEAKHIAKSNVLDYMRIDQKTGFPVLDFRLASREQMGAVASIEVDEDVIAPTKEDDPVVLRRKIRFKMHPKMDAIEKLMRYKGAFINKEPGQGNTTNNTQVNVFTNNPNMTAEEATRAYNKMLDG